MTKCDATLAPIKQEKRKLPRKPNFRRCKGTYYNKKTYKTESFDLGYFMGWGINYDELADGIAGHYTAAIVELPNGEIILPEAYNITFIDKVEEYMKV